MQGQEQSVKEIRIRRDDNGGLRLSSPAGDTVGVVPTACFPWRDSRQFISLRDQNGREIILIDDLALLDETSREAIEASILENSFVLQITKVYSIDTEFEIRHWQVDTRQGRFHFQTRLDEWPQKINATGLLIRDVAGNLLRIDHVDDLDTASLQILWPYLD